jgi:predicted lipoprotein with Yx(FWY)xxD motif
MNARLIIIGALVVLLLSPSLVRAQDVQAPIGIRWDAAYGQILTDDQGRSLYWFSGDEPGVSHCAAYRCEEDWAPLLIAPDSLGMTLMLNANEPQVMKGPLGVLERADGSLQVTWNDWPLYWWTGDEDPGEISGDQWHGEWRVVSLLSTPTTTEDIRVSGLE